jgi:SAM-dependent methyltransferase
MLARNTSGAPLVQGDALHQPFGNGVFDLVVSSLTVGHIEDLDGWSAECARVLQPGGHLVFSDVHPSWEAAGWLRTFNTADGRLFAVRQHWRGLPDVCRSLVAHGFALMRLDEPRLHGDDSPAVAAWRRRWGNPPVALVVHAVKQA